MTSESTDSDQAFCLGSAQSYRIPIPLIVKYRRSITPAKISEYLYCSNTLGPTDIFTAVIYQKNNKPHYSMDGDHGLVPAKALQLAKLVACANMKNV